MLGEIVLGIVFGIIIASIVWLWFSGSLFENVHIRLFEFCYEEIEAEEDKFEIRKRKGIIRGLVRGLTCAFCFTWELSLLTVWRTDFNIFDGFPSVSVTPIEGVVGTASFIVFIAFPLYTILTRAHEDERPILGDR